MEKRDGVEKHGLKKGPWSHTEDVILAAFVKKHGEGNWNAVQNYSGLDRDGKSCRLRWLNHLKPGLKRCSFSKEEEQKIIQLYAKLGTKWSKMAQELPGRTDNEIKNYWNTRKRKRERCGLALYPHLKLKKGLNDNRESVSALNSQQVNVSQADTHEICNADSSLINRDHMEPDLPSVPPPIQNPTIPTPEETSYQLPKPVYSPKVSKGLPPLYPHLKLKKGLNDNRENVSDLNSQQVNVSQADSFTWISISSLINRNPMEPELPPVPPCRENHDCDIPASPYFPYDELFDTPIQNPMEPELPPFPPCKEIHDCVTPASPYSSYDAPIQNPPIPTPEETSYQLPEPVSNGLLDPIYYDPPKVFEVSDASCMHSSETRLDDDNRKPVSWENEDYSNQRDLTNLLVELGWLDNDCEEFPYDIKGTLLEVMLASGCLRKKKN